MQKKIILLAVLILVGTGVFGEPLNQQATIKCLRKVRAFLDDYQNYCAISVEIYGITGRAFDTNQIIAEESTNQIFLLIYFNNEVMFRIFITKDPKKPDSFTDLPEFSYSEKTGYRTHIVEHYDIGKQYKIEYILMSIFNSFNL